MSYSAPGPSAEAGTRREAQMTKETQMRATDDKRCAGDRRGTGDKEGAGQAMREAKVTREAWATGQGTQMRRNAVLESKHEAGRVQNNPQCDGMAPAVIEIWRQTEFKLIQTESLQRCRSQLYSN